MRKTPKRKILRSLFKQHKKNSKLFHFKATKDYFAIIKNKKSVKKD